MAKPDTDSRFFSLFLFFLYATAGVFILYFFIDGFEYYQTSYSLRVRHPDYKLLKPGGFRSHGLGIIGSILLLSLLTYSLRKRFKIFQRFGNLSNWLKIHIFFGISGPAFIILHSTFKLNGLVSVSFWSMIAVAVSGILGRYLYTQIPRNIQGHELSLNEVEDLGKELTGKLIHTYQLDDTQIAELERVQYRDNIQKSDNRYSITNLIIADIKRPFRNNRLKNILLINYNIPKNKIKPLIQLMNQKFALERRLGLWQKIHNMFHYWHVFHKPFAILMYLIMIVHISISIWLGYNWIF